MPYIDCVNTHNTKLKHVTCSILQSLFICHTLLSGCRQTEKYRKLRGEEVPLKRPRPVARLSSNLACQQMTFRK